MTESKDLAEIDRYIRILYKTKDILQDRIEDDWEFLFAEVNNLDDHILKTLTERERICQK